MPKFQFDEQEKYKRDRDRKSPFNDCKNCGNYRRIFARGMCHNCYYDLGLNKHKVLCPKCGNSMPHFARGFCRRCYSSENNMRKYREDPSFKLKSIEYARKWQKAHPEKVKEYNRKSHKFTNRLAKKRRGFICRCGNLIKVSGGAKKNTKTLIKCPQCRNYFMHKELIPCDYNRFTQEIIKRYERGK
jgi:hypothetical protein